MLPHMSKATAHDSGITRPEILDGASLQYAPVNEMGVVFLFANLAKKWRLKVEKIRAAFPDCIAHQKSGGKEKQVRIEFEYRSKTAKDHGDRLKDCDWIVCWEHNWASIPKRLKHLKIIELRKEFGLGFNVWIMAVDDPYKDISERKGKTSFSVPQQAHEGDLLLFYLTRPDCCIKAVFKLDRPIERSKADWHKHVEYYKNKPKSDGKKGDEDYHGEIRRVCYLKSPVFLEHLKKDKILKTAGFVRAQMQWRSRATEYWPFLYEKIVKLNPLVVTTLAKYAPDRI
jgi:hypothetical protein